MNRTWGLWVLVSVVGLFAGNTSKAAVLASDDFEAEGGGTGFVVADEWGNLANGASDTAAANFAFRELSPTVSPPSVGNSIFVAFDFHSTQAIEWGGVALFEGVDGGDETFFLGQPNNLGFYGLDLKGDPGRGQMSSGVPIDDQVHRIVAEIEIGTNDTYRLWVDNLTESIPNNEVTIDGFVFDDPWQSVRVASNVDAGTTVTVDNLVIATTAAEVGLQPALDATLTINRATGEVSLSSGGGVSGIAVYSLRSASGSFDQSEWITIDGRDATDATPPGDGSVDDDDWQVLTMEDSTTDLSEFTFDTTPGDGLTLTGTPLSLGNAWVQTPIEDVFAVVTVDDNGTEVPLAVQVVYTGNAIESGDLDGDGDIDLDDWGQFKMGQGIVNAGMTAVEAYQLGDLDGNFDHNLDDFGLFEEAYDLANGTGAFRAALSNVPEPTSLGVAAMCLAVLVGWRRRLLVPVAFGAIAFAVLGFSPKAHAIIFAEDDFSSTTSGTGWFPGDAWEGLDASGVVASHPNNGGNTVSGRRFNAPIDATNQLTYIRFDYRQQEGTGDAWGGFAFFEGTNIDGQETFFAGANSGNDDVNSYSFDLKNNEDLDSGVPFDNQFHTIIGAVDTTGDDTIYRIWVDNFDKNTPNAEMTITGQGPIDAPWQSLRFQTGGNHEFADNLLITDAAEEALIFQAPPQEVLNLLVNKSTGEVSIENTTGGNVEISAYSIQSSTGMLNAGGSAGDFNADGSVDAADYTVWRNNLGGDSAALNGNGSGGATVDAADYQLWKDNFGNTGGGAGGWESLAERETALGGFPQGIGDGQGWEEGANPSAFEIEEYYLLGQSSVTATPISLGEAYGGGAEGNQDLQFEYRSGGQVLLGSVTYTTGALVAASNNNVPEPATFGLALLVVATFVFLQRARRVAVAF